MAIDDGTMASSHQHLADFVVTYNFGHGLETLRADRRQLTLNTAEDLMLAFLLDRRFIGRFTYGPSQKPGMTFVTPEKRTSRTENCTAKQPGLHPQPKARHRQ